MRERAPVNLGRDLRTGAAVLVALVVLGVVLGWLWSVLAPTTLALVLRDGSAAELQTESYHLFDGLALFALMGLGAGLVTGAAAWTWRTQRGPVVLLLVVAGSLLSARVAHDVGLALVPDNPVGPVGTVIALSPVLGTWGVLVAQPLGAAFAYCTAVALHGGGDLGTGRGKHPDTSHPDTSHPDTWQPSTARPSTSKPGMSKPDTWQPGGDGPAGPSSGTARY